MMFEYKFVIQPNLHNRWARMEHKMYPKFTEQKICVAMDFIKSKKLSAAYIPEKGKNCHCHAMLSRL